MRKIKYKLYYPSHNKVFNIMGIVFNKEGLIDTVYIPIKDVLPEYYGNTDCVLALYPKDKIELLEFTGHYDIDGNEIYEGYIVRFAIPNPTGYENYDGEWVDTTEEEPCGEVILKEGCYCVKYPNGELLPFNTPTSETNKVPIIELFEVIGNIYENKELLDE
jgi:yopX protein|nr:MAG TPA: YopX protein [Caudoviricetes sp.]